ncbi:hypothetical protein [Natrinema versiforme]|uniref:Uncharacterized protein n=1 Tax=Natrinema versiforme JCM 10478 TaxID=1227496 RepID=L9Y1S0_9EURY|nr:hypothetical protein [Natrinema versiforme]ELY68014.1 hypothetical protein C489_08420 [Natrinema versiforme JCM 10478]
MARDRSDAYDRRAWSVVPVLSAAIGRLRRNPSLFAPFAVAGLVLAVVDALRLRDPIPALEYAGIDKATLSLEYAGYPTAVNRTVLPLESLVGLEVPSLAWALGLHVLSLLAVALAGVLTLTWLLDGEAHFDPFPSYLGFVVAIDLVTRFLDWIAPHDMGLFGLGPLAVLLAAMVWLFPAPGLIAAGVSPWTAIRDGGAWIRGDSWSAFGLLVVLGASAWLLASVPIAGALLTGAFVAPVHAVAIVSLFEHRRRDGPFQSPIDH